MSAAPSVTTADFDKEVLQSEVPVLVDFWAAWCGPCRAIAPHVDAVAEEYSGKAKVVKLNVDDAPEIAGPLRRPEHPDADYLQGRPEGRRDGRCRPQSPPGHRRRPRPARLTSRNEESARGKSVPQAPFCHCITVLTCPGAAMPARSPVDDRPGGRVAGRRRVQHLERVGALALLIPIQPIDGVRGVRRVGQRRGLLMAAGSVGVGAFFRLRT